MDSIKRKDTKRIRVGGIYIGGGAPIRVQSMTNTVTEDVENTCLQINRLEEVGCEIVRVAVNKKEAAYAIPKIKKYIKIPLIADIHFDYNLAILSVEMGADGIRINPGNIGSDTRLKKVVDACKTHQVPIRIGVNSGSLEKDLIKKHGGPKPEALVESGLRWIKKIEDMGFFEMKVSLKSSSVMDTVKSYTLFSKKSTYPLHVGITEAGPSIRGAVKSSVGIGLILSKGIGDTIRVSLTGDPVQEIIVAWEILRSLNIRKRGVEIISCPTCARTEIDVLRLSEEVEDLLLKVSTPIKVAVMGCVVNGPGEAKEADIGIAGGRDLGVIFKNGKVIKKVHGRENLIREFKREIQSYVNKKEKQGELRDEI